MALAQAAPAQTAPRAVRDIRDRRAAFNRALAAADVLAENVQLITGSDSILAAGKQAHLDCQVDGFKDSNRLAYFRTTDRVTISPLLPIALEYGHWRGAPTGSTKD